MLKTENITENESKSLSQIELEILELAEKIVDSQNVFCFVDFFCNECFANWNEDFSNYEVVEIENIFCENCDSDNISYHKTYHKG